MPFPSYNSIVTPQMKLNKKPCTLVKPVRPSPLQHVLQHVSFLSCWQQSCATVLRTNLVFVVKRSPQHFLSISTHTLIPCPQHCWQRSSTWKQGLTCILCSKVREGLDWINCSCSDWVLYQCQTYIDICMYICILL